MDTKSKKSKLTVLPLMLAAAFCFSLGAVLADFVAAGLTVFPVVLAMAAALVLGAASLTGTVLLLRRTGYVPRLPAEAGLLFLSGPVLAFLAYGIPFSWFREIYYAMENGNWFLPLFRAVFLLLPLSFAAVYGCAALAVQGVCGQLRNRSLILRFARFLGRKQSLRRKLFLEIAAGFAGAELTLLFLFLAVSLILPRPEALMPVLLFLAPALTAFFLLLLFVRKRSAAGDTEALVSLISGFSGGAFPKDNPVPGDSPLYEAGEQLIHIGRATEAGIQKGIAGEKLKVELITNVSHDLRTPLTSIIGCCEQLSSLELSPEARDYADRLESKSKYLYTMVEDLFDLSKAASGNITLQETDLDLGRLIEQTLGDMDEKIRASGFSIRRRMPDSPLMVRTDGNRMHRVFQNLIDNALKYSLPGTRIYLYAEEQPDFISVSIVNTASYDMDFDAETITERFVRGSAARTGEGSGLGLAIARTYTEACGGAFRITVKGDQFEAAVRFPRQHSPIN